MTLTYPDPITHDRVSELEHQGVAPDIAGLDLEMVKMKLRDPDEGAGWTAEQCESAEVEYKRFLHLNRSFREQPIVPNVIMDTMWHFHILDTRRYVADSERLFGGYFHHYPYFGMRGEEDEGPRSRLRGDAAPLRASVRRVDGPRRGARLLARLPGPVLARVLGHRSWAVRTGRRHRLSTMTKKNENALVPSHPAEIDRRDPGHIRFEHGDSALEVGGDAAVPVGIGIGVAIAAIGIALGVRIVSESNESE